MAGRSVILQKKLHELESELSDIIRLPLDLHLQIAFDDINQRFIFLNNLLLQEIASSQPRNSATLHETGRRLTALKAAFCQWNDWRLSVCSDCTQALFQSENFSGEMSTEKLLCDFAADEMIGLNREGCTQVVPYDNHDVHDVRKSGPDPIPDFSGEMSPENILCGFEAVEMIGSNREGCTQVVPYDDDVRGSGSDPICDSGDFSGEKMPEKFFDSIEKDENVRKEGAAAVAVAEEKVWSKMGKYGGVFGCGMIVGAICMVKLFFNPSSHHFIGYEALLLPPT